MCLMSVGASFLLGIAEKTDLTLKVVFNQESSYSYYFTETSVSVECSKLEESESTSLQWRNVGFS